MLQYVAGQKSTLLKIKDQEKNEQDPIYAFPSILYPPCIKHFMAYSCLRWTAWKGLCWSGRRMKKL